MGSRMVFASVPKGKMFQRGSSELMLNLSCGNRQAMNGSFSVGDKVLCEHCGEQAEIMAMFEREVKLKDKLRRKFWTGPRKKWETKKMEREFRSIQRKAMRG